MARRRRQLAGGDGAPGADEAARPMPGRAGAACLGILAALGWFGILWWVTSRPSPDYATAPLCFLTSENVALLASPRNEPMALPLERRAAAEGRYEHRLALRLPGYRGPLGRLGPSQVVRDADLKSGELRSLDLYLEAEAGRDGGWQGEVPLGIVGGQLRLPGGPTLQAVAPDRVRRGRPLEFRPVSGTTNGANAGELVLETRQGRTLYLRGVVRTMGPGSAEAGVAPLGRLVVALGPQPGQPATTTNLFYPDGRCTYPLATLPPPARRTLLARLHQVPDGAVIWRLVAGGLAVGLGFAGLAWACGRTGPGRALPAGASVAALALGLALPATVLMPPFQGPDEVRHAISYVRLTESRELLDGVLGLIRSSHYDTVKYRPDLKLTAATLEQPDVFAVNLLALDPKLIDQFFQDYNRRSPAVAVWWRFWSRVLPESSVGTLLLRVRTVQVLLGAMLLGLGAFVASSGRFPGVPVWLLLAPLLVGTLPPVLACISNYSTVVGCAGLLAGVLVRQAWRYETDSWWVGAWLGFALGLALHVSLNGLAFLPGAALWLVHRPWLRWMGAEETEPRMARVQVGRWWFAAMLGFAVTRVFGTRLFNAELVGQASSHLGTGWLGSFVAEPVSLWTLVCVVLGGLEWAACGGGGDRARRTAGEFIARASWLAWPALILLVGTALLHLVRPAPHLVDQESPWRHYPGLVSSGCPLWRVAELGEVPPVTPPRGEGVLAVLRVLWANLNPWPADFLLVRSFWAALIGGEVRVPGWMVPLGASVAFLGLVQGLVVLGSAGSARRTAQFLCGLIAFLATLVIQCLGYWPRNFGGRYATPLFLVGISMVALGWAPLLDTIARRRPLPLALGVLALVLLTHGAWAWALGERFF